MTKKRITVLDIPIDTINKKEVKSKIRKSLEKRKSKLVIATVNSSFILKTLLIKEFKEVLKYKTDLNTPDGVGIQIAAEYIKKYNSTPNIFIFTLRWLKIALSYVLGKNELKVIPQRITGVYITKYLLKIANKKRYKVIVIHKKNGLQSKKELIKNFKKNFKYIKLFIINVDDKQDRKKYVINKKHKAKIVLADMGEVKQELFLNNNKQIEANLYIGIGSSLDIIFNKIKPAPKVFRKRGLEWLFRIMTRPKRIKKAFNSVIIFPYKLYKESLKYTK